MNNDRSWHIVSICPPEGQGWLACKEWCLKMVQGPDWRYHGEGVFEFKYLTDATMFRLRWI